MRGAFVGDFRLVLQRQEPVQKPRRDPELAAIHGAQLLPMPLPVGRTAAADIDRNIEQTTTPAAHELALRIGRGLKVHTPDRVRLSRNGMVVLYEVRQHQVGLRQRPLVPGFREIAARIAEPFRRQAQDAGQAGLFDLQGRILFVFVATRRARSVLRGARIKSL